MTEVRLQPQLTTCFSYHGQLTNSDGVTRHTAFIQLLGKCRICDETRIYEGSRERMVEMMAEALLKIYVSIDENDAEAVWSVDDEFFASVMNLAEEELPEHVEADAHLEVDYDAEGLRIIHQALILASRKIEAHLNSSGEEL